MKNSRLLSALCIVVIAGIIGCSKDGTTGPAGPAGADGAAGPAGPAGPDSVITSLWTPLNLVQDVLQPGDTMYLATVTAASITQNILDGGVVLTYLEFIDTATYGPGIFNASEAVQVTYNVGSINILSFNDYRGLFDVRYIIVPSSMIASGTGKGYSKEQWQTMSYSAVQKAISSSSGSSGIKN
jgi:hypothetical protein